MMHEMKTSGKMKKKKRQDTKWTKKKQKLAWHLKYSSFKIPVTKEKQVR